MRERLEELDTLNEPMRTETAQVSDYYNSNLISIFVSRIDFPKDCRYGGGYVSTCTQCNLLVHYSHHSSGVQVTQQEFVQRIEEMSRQMAQAWDMEQRVKALKIVIQVRPHISKPEDQLV